MSHGPLLAKNSSEYDTWSDVYPVGVYAQFCNQGPNGGAKERTVGVAASCFPAQARDQHHGARLEQRETMHLPGERMLWRGWCGEGPAPGERHPQVASLRTRLPTQPLPLPHAPQAALRNAAVTASREYTDTSGVGGAALLPGSLAGGQARGASSTSDLR